MSGSVDSVSIAGRPGSAIGSAVDIPLLSSLPKPVRERLLHASRVERFAARAQLFEGGESAQYLHAILSGLVDLSCTYKSGECTALMMATGDVFMPAVALSSSPIWSQLECFRFRGFSYRCPDRQNRSADLSRACARACTDHGGPMARRAQDHSRPQMSIAIAAAWCVPSSAERRIPTRTAGRSAVFEATACLAHRNAARDLVEDVADACCQWSLFAGTPDHCDGSGGN